MINIKGSYVGNRSDTVEALEFFGQGTISTKFKVMNLEELPKVYDLMKSGMPLSHYFVDGC